VCGLHAAAGVFEHLRRVCLQPLPCYGGHPICQQQLTYSTPACVDCSSLSCVLSISSKGARTRALVCARFTDSCLLLGVLLSLQWSPQVAIKPPFHSKGGFLKYV
jgi:hypothetical protein